ncbi:prolyl oligopeptidase family serine peptidase [uncultured Tenacibaculum sp.]|uniref:prolyl oligopeptidase family serine peptidase n=1 Tax=uncultured Tenacibaculum sp. TaxID=174713 RepID=UPI00261B4709|nr:prolyl oligopeptidase family serine peptidase [uncultured Tenacibaculum sp.]
MKKVISIFVLLLTIISCNNTTPKKNAYNYPKIEKEPVTEEYCGVSVTDDYRNLENLKDSSVIKWFEDQETYANNYLNKVKGSETLYKKMTSYASRSEFETKTIWMLDNGNYFYLKQYVKENKVILCKRNSLNGDEQFIFNSQEYKKGENKNYVIRSYVPSWDGKKVAIALTHADKEYSEVLIIDIETQKVLIDGIPNFWSGLSWLKDNTGIYFTSFADNYKASDDHFKNMSVILYKLGWPASKKETLFSKETAPELNLTNSDLPFVSVDRSNDKYVIGRKGGATAYSDRYYCLSSNFFNKKNVKWLPLVKKEDKIKKVIIHNDSVFALTAINNTNYEIIKTDLNKIEWTKDNTLISPKEGEVIKSFVITSVGLFYTTSINGVKAKLYHFKNNKSTEIELPMSAASSYIGNLSSSKPDLWVFTRGWLNKLRRFKYDFNEKKFTPEELSPVATYPEFENFTVKEVEVTAHDGEKIPLSIIHKKDIKRDGSNPTLLLAYGSYGRSYTPGFSESRLTWVEQGGIIAIAHVRGGGEKGSAWYLGGKKLNKPNTWKDMISCTEYMINEKYTSNKKTVITGTSAGGIMAGRSITERPDLYAVSLIRVGTLNMLRNEEGPNGANNVKEFGTYKNPEECSALLEMDAYSKIKENEKYPATIITAGLNDLRVVPWAPGKFAARLQEKNKSDKPIIFYVQSNKGHGVNEAELKIYRELSNLFAFAFAQVGHPGFEVKK